MESDTKPCEISAQSQPECKPEDVEGTDVGENKNVVQSETSMGTAQLALDDNRPPSQTTGKDKKRKKRCAPESNEHELYGYTKKKLLNYLKEKGCNTRFFEKEVSSCKLRMDVVLDYFNKHAEQAQLHVHQECNSLSFENIDSWLQLFKSWDLPDQSYYEQAIVVNAIANNEKQPKAQELGGVNLQSIYKFIGNALLGLPQPELDQESAKFLAREFELLVEDANSSAGDLETRRMKSLLLLNNDEHMAQRKHKLSLDPLWLDDSIE